RALPPRRRVCALRDRTRTRRSASRLPSFRALQTRLRAVALVDAATADDAERIQRVARVCGGRMGAGERARTRVAQLRALRRVARPGSGADGTAKARAPSAAAAEG